MKFINALTGEIYYRKKRHRFDNRTDAREFTFCCYKWIPFLCKDRTRTWLLEEIDLARGKYGFHIWAYVIMPEHVHLLLASNGTQLEFGKVIGEVKENVARQAIAYMEQHSPQWLPRITVREGSKVRRRFWQPGGGYDRNVDSVTTVHRMITSIHMNPVRRNLALQAVDWYWSSCRWYHQLPDIPLRIDASLPVSYEIES